MIDFVHSTVLGTLGENLMSDELQRLQTTLDEVQSRLAQSSELDDVTRRLLSQLENEIVQALEEQNPQHFVGHSIMDRLREAEVEFEAEHPTLSQFLLRTINGLAQMGI